MAKLYKLIGSIILLMGATDAATIPIPASAQEPTPSTTAPTEAPVTRLPRMDPKHPLHIGANYYPKESLKHREQGRCVLAVFAQADGSVPAAQLLKSAGYPRLDTACIESVIDVPVLPAVDNGTPVAGWGDFTMAWLIGPPQFARQPPLEKTAVPRIANDYELQVGEMFYPEAARAKHERGYCVVHTIVDPTGAVRDARITRSTGSPILDKACLDAVTPARFTPELQNGVPVEDTTDISIYWREEARDRGDGAQTDRAYPGLFQGRHTLRMWCLPVSLLNQSIPDLKCFDD
jgi:TonB family protein